MILVDTSVWIDHLAKTDETMLTLLKTGRVRTHPLVIGEIAMGNFRQRDRILSDLGSLPQTSSVSHSEAMAFITSHKLYGTGIGYIDAHLLAAVLLTSGTLLWSRDKRLHNAANVLGLAFYSIH